MKTSESESHRKKTEHTNRDTCEVQWSLKCFECSACTSADRDPFENPVVLWLHAILWLFVFQSDGNEINAEKFNRVSEPTSNARCGRTNFSVCLMQINFSPKLYAELHLLLSIMQNETKVWTTLPFQLLNLIRSLESGGFIVFLLPEKFLHRRCFNRFYIT